ncbi:hypothetical protein MT391_16390 [Vibrio sp. 1-Bac 57]|uniref:hypothetical protein n=1 Tax=Psychromonas arctica TaxID=168275 RepID=UPI0003F50F44|nr:hypothetical protein [Psychromonas arctica]
MNIVKQLLIICIGLSMCIVVQADQAQRVSQKEATLALQFLKDENIHLIKKFCKPCGDQLPQNVLIDTVAIQDAHYKGLWELVVNGQAIDLAYYYLPTQDRWKNFARVVDIYVDDMPKYLESSEQQLKTEGAEGWYIDKERKIISNKELTVGSLMALLGRGQHKKLSVFFQATDKLACEDESLKDNKSFPMYLNGTLVKFKQQCNGDVLTFFAETEAGNDFVLEQFIQESEIKLSPYATQDAFVFTNKGFEKLYKRALLIAR